MFEVARTPAALFRQMRAQERGLAELELVRRALDLDVEVYTARFEPDGTPFQVHGTGTASVMVQLGAPAHVVCVAVLHNAFRTGDWGDARAAGLYEGRRARVRRLLSEDTERFMVDSYSAQSRPTAELLAADDLDPDDRWRALIRLADLLDKWDDGRVMYSADGRTDRAYVAARRPDIVALARKLGTAEFAESLEFAFERVAAETIPESLKAARVYSSVVPPASYRMRRRVAAKAAGLRTLRRARRAVRHRLGR